MPLQKEFHEVVRARVTTEQKRAFKAYCKAKKVEVSEQIREWIDEALKAKD